MKTSKNSTAKDISQVVTKFLENKSDFSLDCDEKGNLYTLLMDELLEKYESDHRETELFSNLYISETINKL